MSIFTRIYGDALDRACTGSSTIYLTARASTAAGNSTALTVAIGQSFATPNYAVNQGALVFDTSTIPAGASIYLSLWVSVAGTTTTDPLEIRQSATPNNKIAGASLAGLTLLGSFTTPTATGRFSTLLTGDPTRDLTSDFRIHSQAERLATAPTVNDQFTAYMADQTGTTNDPYLDALTGTAWTYVGRGTSVEAAVTTHTLTEPAGVAAGDLLVACIVSRVSVATSITLPAGWTRVGEQLSTSISSSSTAARPSGTMAYIVRGASPPSYTFTHPIAPVPALGRVVAYRNVDQTTPFDVGGSGQTAFNVTAVSVTGITTTADDDLIVAAALGGQEAAWSLFGTTDPATNSGTTADSVLDPIWGQWLERSDIQTTSNNDTSLAILDAIKQVAGATGNFTATASVAAGHAVIAGAFKIAAAGPPPSSGTLTATLDDATLSATGTVADQVANEGTADITLGAATLAATGKVLIQGQLVMGGAAAPATTFTRISTNIALSNGDLTATVVSSVGAYEQAATQASIPDKVYGEFTWSTLYAVGNNAVAAGIFRADLSDGFFNPGIFLGYGESVGWYLGELYNDGGHLVSAPTFDVGDVLAIAWNKTTGEVSVRNVTTASAWSTPTVAPNLIGYDVRFIASPFYVTDALTVNFDGTFAGSPPDGTYQRWQGASAPGGLAPATLVATGTVASAPTTSTGTLTATLEAATLAGTGTVFTPIPGTDYGALTATLADATLVATSKVDIKGAAAVTLGAATLVGTGTLTLRGVASVTLAPATLAGTGTLALKGAAAVTLGPVTLIGTGIVYNTGFEPHENVREIEGVDWRETEQGIVRLVDSISVGDLSRTLGPATLSATGAVLIRGVASATLAPATLAATGKVDIKGTLSATLGPATLNAAGALSVKTGSLSATLAPATLSATGIVYDTGTEPHENVRETESVDWRETEQGAVRLIDSISLGTLSVTLGAATLSASGTVSVRATLAATLAPATLVASGALTAGPVAPDYDGVRETEGGDWRETEDGTIRIIDRISVGVLSATLAPATLSAAGLVSDGPLPPDRDGARQTEGDDFRETEDGKIRLIEFATVTGTLAATLAPATLAATGTVVTPIPDLVTGTLTATLAPATLAAVGSVSDGVPILGTLDVTLADATLSATGHAPARWTPEPPPWNTWIKEVTDAATWTKTPSAARYLWTSSMGIERITTTDYRRITDDGRVRVTDSVDQNDNWQKQPILANRWTKE